MDQQTFQILILVFSILISIIGFFLVMGINDIKAKIRDHDETLKQHRTMIDQNTSRININSERDELNQKYLTETLTRLEGSIKECLTLFQTEVKELRQEISSNKRSTNNKSIKA